MRPELPATQRKGTVMTKMQEEPKTTEPSLPKSDGASERVKLLARALYDVQKLRIGLQLRIGRLVRDEIMAAEAAERFFEIPFGLLEDAEKAMADQLWDEVRERQIVAAYLVDVKGIGPRLSGLLVANIGNATKYATVSKLWAYAGLHVIDGKAVRRAKGERANWNAELKTTCWKIAASFVKIGDSPYRLVYTHYKQRIVEREMAAGNIIWASINDKWHAQYYDGDQVTLPEKAPTTKPEWTLGRINAMAMRYTVKMFLSHLWQVWRAFEGQPSDRPPYAVEYLDHQHIMDPWDFVGTGRGAWAAKKALPEPEAGLAMEPAQDDSTGNEGG